MSTLKRALQTTYPWIKQPLIISAPMLNASTPHLAMNVSRAGGMGFIAGGTNPEALEKDMKAITADHDRSPLVKAGNPLPIGIGFQIFNAPLEGMAEVIKRHTPAVVWLFAPKHKDDYRLWAERIRKDTKRRTSIWIQIGSIAEAQQVLPDAEPDALIMQGTDAGGHGLVKSSSIISLVPEVLDLIHSTGKQIPVFAAGGIVEARGAAAALTLGASGVVMGTRFLASNEAGIAAGWKSELLKTRDGGVTTVRSTLCDRLKETKGWPEVYDGRMVRNAAVEQEATGSWHEKQNVEMYKREMAKADEERDWGPGGRLVTYAGTGVGLVKEVKGAGEIVEEVREGTVEVLRRSAALVGKGEDALSKL